MIYDSWFAFVFSNNGKYKNSKYAVPIAENGMF